MTVFNDVQQRRTSTAEHQAETGINAKSYITLLIYEIARCNHLKPSSRSCGWKCECVFARVCVFTLMHCACVCVSGGYIGLSELELTQVHSVVVQLISFCTAGGRG